MEFNTAAVKKEIVSALNVNAKSVSLRRDSCSIRLELKEWADLDKAQSIVRRFEKVERDERTGEILLGANTYVSATFDYRLTLTDEQVARCAKVLATFGESMTGSSLDYWFTQAVAEEFGIGKATAGHIVGRFSSRPENRARFR